jgi:hypothetical protein
LLTAQGRQTLIPTARVIFHLLQRDGMAAAAARKLVYEGSAMAIQRQNC